MIVTQLVVLTNTNVLGLITNANSVCLDSDECMNVSRVEAGKVITVT